MSLVGPETTAELYWKLTMSIRGLTATGALILSMLCSSVAAQNRVEMEVPPAQHLTIVGEDGNPIPQRRAARRPRLTLSLPVARDGTVVKPANLEALVATLRESLSLEYRQRLAAYFGFSRRNRARVTAGNLRLVDLQSFLFDVFNLGDRSTLLGRQIYCVSSGERDLTAVFALLVYRETTFDDTYTRRRDVPRDVTVRSALLLAYTLAYVCREGR